MELDKEYYYKLEAALIEHNLLENNFDELKEFNISSYMKDNVFLQALCLRYGIFGRTDIDEYFRLLKTLEEQKSSVEISFIYYQLSDYYLKFAHNMELYEKYFHLAIDKGHRLALQEHIEFILDTTENVDLAIKYCKQGINSGNEECHLLLIECYIRKNNFEKALEQYATLLDIYKIKSVVNDIDIFANSYCIIEDEKLCEKYLELLILSSNIYTIELLKKYQNLITPELLISILSNKDKIDNKIVFPKLLSLFNYNNNIFEHFLITACQ